MKSDIEYFKALRKTSIAPNRREKMRVFKINEFDWYIGKDEESAISAAMKDSGLSREDVVDDMEFHEVGPKEMKTLKLLDDEWKPNGTFEDLLNKMISEGREFPCFFAGIEA